MPRSDTTVDLSNACEHVAEVKIREVQRPGKVCPECVAVGSDWVHLRECLVCGHVGCCDDSPNRHATKHFHKTRHAVMTSLEEGETWTWCFVDKRMLSE
jgi:uncharacterized UBP type Zn finger protein